jgi:uncharacterized spore protein YtfJ
MFLFGFLAGALVTGVVFIVFHKNNMNKIAKARTALLDIYERVGDQVGDVVKGVDKKLDKDIEQREQNRG